MNFLHPRTPFGIWYFIKCLRDFFSAIFLIQFHEINSKAYELSLISRCLIVRACVILKGLIFEWPHSDSLVSTQKVCGCFNRSTLLSFSLSLASDINIWERVLNFLCWIHLFSESHILHVFHSTDFEINFSFNSTYASCSFSSLSSRVVCAVILSEKSKKSRKVLFFVTHKQLKIAGIIVEWQK